MANEKTPVVWDDATKKHRPLGTGEKMGGLDASSLLSSDSGNLLEAGSDGLAYLSGSGVVDPRADNLLEESDRGKLQVTIGRIVEWLDGHPQDAAAVAEAVNVVSGDAGNVITAGSDKGAFLSKGAIAAAVAGMTDAQKAQLADAIAARIASDVADGQTIVASGGKLHSDPTNATAAQKKAINQALADPNSGLVVDNSTGKLKVDFSQMPTDKFEELLASLDMLIPLRANLDLYVGLNGADDQSDGRGTQSKPFRTIQYAVNYVAGKYNIGTYRVRIFVLDGDYGTSVINLPSYAASTGYVLIQSYSGNKSSVRVGALKIAHAGSTYNIRHLTATHPSISAGIAGVFEAQNGGRLELRDVVADQSGIANSGGGSTFGFYAAENGIIRWWTYNDNDAPTGVPFVASSSSTVAGCMAAAAGGEIIFASDINVSGSFSCANSFVNSNQFGLVTASQSVYGNPGRTPRVNNSGTVTGGRYRASRLSIIPARGANEEAAKAYYPGDSEGIVQTGSQFNWGDVHDNS